MVLEYLGSKIKAMNFINHAFYELERMSHRGYFTGAIFPGKPSDLTLGVKFYCIKLNFLRSVIGEGTKELL